MDVVDQVAIHEAMEQQTISITKAGIQATLNARTAILAAANPIKGRYDTSRTLRQNVDISAPIMSRFDLFFVVIDHCNDVTDYNIARHIVSIHMNQNKAVEVDFSKEDLQLYVRFARTLKPKISPDAKKIFVEQYRKLRQNDVAGSAKTSYRITVRQLESMVRLSEAIARLHLEDTVEQKHVLEAARLIEQSIIRVDAPPVDLDDGEGYDPFDDDDDDNDEDDDGDEALEIPANSEKTTQPMSEDQQDKQGKDKDSNEKVARSSTPAPNAGDKKRKKKKPKLRISYEQYVSTASLVTDYVRREELKGANGKKESELLDWCLKMEEKREEAADEEKLSLLRRKIKHIINRLITVDGVLQVLNKDEKDASERVLSVNPNYDPDCANEFLERSQKEAQKREKEGKKKTQKGEKGAAKEAAKATKKKDLDKQISDNEEEAQEMEEDSS